MDNLLMPLAQKPDCWYRQPWLLLVFGGPAIVVVACLYTIFLAYHGADKIIAPDYYRQGLAINKVIRLDDNAHLRQLAGGMQLDAASGVVTLHIDGSGRMPNALGLVIAQTGDSAEEKITRTLLTRKEANTYQGELVVPSNFGLGKSALWHVKVEAADWRLTADWHDPAHTRLELKAAK